jgi:predicted lipoprotein with Yx(FWY)xxD motif
MLSAAKISRLLRPAHVGVVGALLAAAGYGGAESSAGAALPRPSTAAAGALIEVVPSKYGRVVADSRGEALYLFTKDGRGPSRCYGACAKAWPPVLTRGTPKAGKGITVSGLGTRRRSDGRVQVTYEGQPLYYYAQDKPGLILCQNVAEYGGTWLVVAPSGKAVR